MQSTVQISFNQYQLSVLMWSYKEIMDIFGVKVETVKLIGGRSFWQPGAEDIPIEFTYMSAQIIQCHSLRSWLSGHLVDPCTTT